MKNCSVVVELKREGQAAIFVEIEIRYCLPIIVRVANQSTYPIQASRKDFTIISTFIKLRPPLLSGWHTTFRLTLYIFLIFPKKREQEALSRVCYCIRDSHQ